jgi:hypothetical protein
MCMQRELLLLSWWIGKSKKKREAWPWMQVD